MGKTIDLKKTHHLLMDLLKPEISFFSVAIIYGIAISLLTLAVPVAVQTLVSTIANIGSTRAVAILSTLLFFTLLIASIMYALRIRVMEHYERRVYARLTAELSLKTIMAPHSFFEGRRNTAITQRYFDIMTLQKNIPPLMVDGFALILQMIVGFTLVSFYHPMLFAFNLVLLIFLYLALAIWSKRAKVSAIELSQAKYSTAKWLNDIAAAHEFFKSSRHLDYAGKTTEKHIEYYNGKHYRHFSNTFAQACMFLFLYAAASGSLLGLGGWLVIQGELSIGQLVAAELIMAAVFFGMARFSMYLKLYYELFGTADKIGSALSIPQEHIHDGAAIKLEKDACLEFKDLQLERDGYKFNLNLTLQFDEKAFIKTDHSWIQRELIQQLKFFENSPKGSIRLGGLELSDIETFELRQMIMTVDRSLIIECTIEEYLRFSARHATNAAIRDALERVGLHHTIERLPNGIKTVLTPLGTPLLPMELLLLKTAAVVLAKPRVAIINQHFDAIPAYIREELLVLLAEQPFIVMYFTNQPDNTEFGRNIQLGVSL